MTRVVSVKDLGCLTVIGTQAKNKTFVLFMHLLVVSKYESESCWQLCKNVSKCLFKRNRQACSTKACKKYNGEIKLHRPFPPSLQILPYALHLRTTTVSQNVQRRLDSHMTWVHQQTPLVPPSTGREQVRLLDTLRHTETLSVNDAWSSFRSLLAFTITPISPTCVLLRPQVFCNHQGANAINCYHYLPKPSILRYHFSF